MCAALPGYPPKPSCVGMYTLTLHEDHKVLFSQADSFWVSLAQGGCDWSRSAPLPIPREAQSPQELIS